MKKIFAAALLIIIILTTGCETKQPKEPPVHNAIDYGAKSEERYQRVMSEWKPAQMFETAEFNYGIDGLTIEASSEGGYVISFTFEAVFKLASKLYIAERVTTPTYSPTLYLGSETGAQLKRLSWENGNSGKIDGIGPFITRLKYFSDELPTGLYFKTPNYQYWNPNARKLISDRSAYEVRLGSQGFAVVKFNDASVVNNWENCILSFGDTQTSGSIKKDPDTGQYYAECSWPQGAVLPKEYTLTLRDEHFPSEQKLFKIDLG